MGATSSTLWCLASSFQCYVCEIHPQCGTEQQFACFLCSVVHTSGSQRGGNFSRPPSCQGTVGYVWRHLGLSEWRERVSTVIWCVEAQDTAMHPATHTPGHRKVFRFGCQSCHHWEALFCNSLLDEREIIFVCSVINRCLGCFQFGTTTTSTTVIGLAHICFCTHLQLSFGANPRSEVSGS